MALDLSALEEKPIPKNPTEFSGKPTEIPLEDILEDPDQPRFEFDNETLRELTESIRERGVKSPISVRPHPDHSGKWILNYGARRYRGSLAAGMTTIPAFVDENHDDYDQVIENLQRENLKPRELALFIKKRVDAGDKKSLIAKRLCKPNHTITHHLALIDLPKCIDEVFNTGKCTSAETLYGLRKLHDQNPAKVEEWCESGTDVTRQTVATLAEELSGKKSAVVTERQNENSDHDQNVIQPEREQHANENSAETEQNTQGTEGEQKTKKKKEAPLLLVEYEGQSAEVLLNKRPNKDGFLFINCTDGQELEVDASLCKISKLLFVSP